MYKFSCLKHYKIYFTTILLSVLLVYCFFLIQTNIVLGIEIQVANSIIPTLVGIVFGILLGKVLVLRKENENYQSELEQKNTKLEKIIKNIFANAPVGIEFFDKNGNFTNGNYQAAEIFGVDKEDIKKVKYNFFDDPNLPEESKKLIKDGFPKLDDLEIDFDLINKYGLYPTKKSGKGYIQGVIFPIFDEKNELLHYTAFVIDQTQKKLNEEKIVISNQNGKIINQLLNISLQSISFEEKLNKALRVISSVNFMDFETKGGIFLFREETQKLELFVEYNLDRNILNLCKEIDLNQCLCGKAAEAKEIIFKSCIDEEHSIKFEEMEDHGHYSVPILREKKLLGVLVLYLSKGHKRKDLEIEFLKSVASTLASIIQNNIDEKNHLRSQRLESIGAITSGIAHDLNNIFTPILMSSQLLKSILKEQNNLRKVETITHSVQRGANILKQILGFAKGFEGNFKKVNIAKVLLNTVNFVKETFPKSIEFEYKISKDLGKVYGDSTQIDQVFLNLCVNARDAMENSFSKKLKITAENLTETEKEEHLSSNYLVKITISDTGKGIPKEHLEKIYDPFFTTKKLGRGTGLGLSTVFSIVQKHNGKIEVESEVGKGTIFKVLLPALPEKNTLVEEQNKEENVLGDGKANGELVLVVDDEPNILDSIESILKLYNFKIITAENGCDGVKKFIENIDEIKIVITDIMMPIMDGKLMIEEIKNKNKDVKIIVTSGVFQSKTILDENKTSYDLFLQKPYSTTFLINKMQELLNGSKIQNEI